MSWASQRRRKFLFLSSVRKPSRRVLASVITPTPCCAVSADIYTEYPTLHHSPVELHAAIFAWCGAQPLSVAIKRDAHIFHNVDRYRPPVVQPPSQNFHRDVVCGGVTDHLIQKALAA